MSLLPRVLAPAAWLYNAAAKARYRSQQGEQASVPVICVGNFVAGGAGKTPTALAVADLLAGTGRKPGFLIRGYGGSTAGPLLVDTGRHDSNVTGDEALMLAARAPTVVSADRPAGALLLAGQDIDTIVMDDGLQNPSLQKAFSIAVVDADYGVGNGRVMPAGPLRADLDFQFSLAHALLLIGDGAPGAEVAARAEARRLPVLRGKLQLVDAETLANEAVVAFAGIGRPEKFFASLRDAGADIKEAVAFADHHRFSDTDARRLLALADRHGTTLVTTRKDAVRLTGADGDLAALARACRVVDVRLAFDDEKRLAALMKKQVG